VLEVGTGLGYQAAVLAELASQVWSVEIIEELASQAELRRGQLGYSTVGIRVGDGATPAAAPAAGRSSEKRRSTCRT
jgi:protein-L-isoaspartate(D-aspartate) O-methyltransferase